MRLTGCALALGLAACSPWGGGAYHCETDAQCEGGPGAGKCELTGFCSFADPACASGQRYGSSSGEVSNACVGEEPQADAGIDAEVVIDGPPIDGQVCVGTPLVVCLTETVSGARTISGMVDTDGQICDQTQAQTGGPDLCILTGAQVTVGAVRAQGSRPLVIVATDTLTVTGALDVSSKRTGMPGAGANAAACMAATNGENDAGGGAGGGGGGFGANGGTAGHGDSNNSDGNDGDSAGGTGGAASVSAFVRGGCKGGNGGNSGGDAGGAGANGGGAVYLIAGNAITVMPAGAINASGGGGTHSHHGSGGGAGGSGGLVGLDAPAIMLMGAVTANGGGGGGGSGTASDGDDGGDGTSGAMWDQRATGGPGATQNPVAQVPGGRGGAINALEGEGSGTSAGGSGGAGGGVGVIWTHGTVTGTMLSPPATPH